MLVVPNAEADPRFKHNPWVLGGPLIRFYAGHPIRTPDGFKVGALCAIDTRPRELTAEQAQTLKDLAGLVEVELAGLLLSEIQKGLIAELQADRDLLP